MNQSAEIKCKRCDRIKVNIDKSGIEQIEVFKWCYDLVTWQFLSVFFRYTSL